MVFAGVEFGGFCVFVACIWEEIFIFSLFSCGWFMRTRQRIVFYPCVEVFYVYFVVVVFAEEIVFGSSELPFRVTADRKQYVCWLIHCAYSGDRAQP